MTSRLGHGRGAILALGGTALFLVAASTPAKAQCVGDCNGDGMVVINELVLGVNIALGLAPVSACEAFANQEGIVNVAQLVRGVNNALNGCPPPGATPTATEPVGPTATATQPIVPTSTATAVPTGTATATHTVGPPPTVTDTPTEGPSPSPTNTPTEGPSPTPTETVAVCPLDAGRYTITTTSGSLRVATFAPFPFPAGGTTLQDVGAGNADCVHDTVIPFPGGLTVPPFCVPALGATTTVTQSGCGIGRIDSDGGSDFTVTEDGDTSDLDVCNVPQATCPATGPAPDSSGRIDITVGNGVVDTCASGGTANAIVTIPVYTVTWVDADGACPDEDGMFDPDTDTLLAEFPQTLDLTTDTNTARYTDLSGDGCALSGLGPAGPFANTGHCIDLEAMTVSIAGSGTIFNSGAPTYDLLFTTIQNNNVSGPTASGGAICDDPPTINFDGLAHRCLDAP